MQRSHPGSQPRALGGRHGLVSRQFDMCESQTRLLGCQRRPRAMDAQPPSRLRATPSWHGRERPLIASPPNVPRSTSVQVRCAIARGDTIAFAASPKVGMVGALREEASPTPKRGVEYELTRSTSSHDEARCVVLPQRQALPAVSSSRQTPWRRGGGTNNAGRGLRDCPTPTLVPRNADRSIEPYAEI